MGISFIPVNYGYCFATFGTQLASPGKKMLEL